MHPNAAFHAPEADGWALVESVGFATIACAGPVVANAPLTRHGPAELRFHLARANRAFPAATGRVVASLLGPHGYVSPGWYEADDPGAVPTWNYLAAEFEGAVTRLSDAELREHLERKASGWEPETPHWTLAATDPRRADAMLAAIGGFRLTVDAVRVTTKLSQNKPAADRRGVAAGLRRRGNTALAERMAAT